MGGVRRIGEAGRQFGADGGLHIGGQAGQDGAVQGVLGGGPGRGAEEMFGQLAQQGAALLARPFLGHGDQFGEAGRHRRNCH